MSGTGASGSSGGSFKPLRAGALRRKLVIQQATQTRDGMLGATTSWTTLLTTWGSVTAKQNNTLLQVMAGRQMTQTVYDIVVRYPPSLTITPGMRVVDAGRIYTISNVNDTDERHRMLHLACVEAPGA